MEIRLIGGFLGAAKPRSLSVRKAVIGLPANCHLSAAKTLHLEDCPDQVCPVFLTANRGNSNLSVAPATHHNCIQLTMKQKTKNKPSIFRMGKAALLASCALLLPHLQATAATTTLASSGLSLNLSQCGIGTGAPGQLSNLAIFTLGAGSGDTDTLSGNAIVSGDMAVAGSGKITLSNSARIQGNLSYKTTGTLTRTGNTTVITGTVYKNSSTDSILNLGVSAANLASSIASALPASSGYPTTINSNTSLSLTSSGLAVLKLSDFKLSNNAVLTLQGTAASAFVINVNNTFSLASATVKLSGGITWDHVIFNVANTGSATLTGNSLFNGVLLAAKRNVSLADNAIVNGAIIANTVALSANARCVRPPLVSP
jgi:hypothetical protein